MQLELTQQEWEELRELVHNAYAETNPEMRRSRSHEYRQQIHQRRELLASLLKRLEAQPQPVA
jgi:hypothetical protein